MGRSYYQQNNFPAANQNALNALKGYQKLSSETNVCLTYDLLGHINIGRKDYVKALQYYNNALRLRIKHSRGKDISNSYENIADLFAKQKKYDLALKNYQTSINFLVPDLKKEASLEQTGLQNKLVVDKRDLLRVLSLKAATLLDRFEQAGQQEDLLGAYALHQKMDTLVVMIRQQYKAPGSKFFLAENSLAIYEKAIETALYLFEQTGNERYLEEAYVYSAKNKAIVLLGGLQGLNAKSVGIPAAILEKEEQLKKKYSILESQIFSSMNQVGQDSLLEANRFQLFETKRDLKKLERQLENNYPNYYDLKYSIPSLSTINTLQDSLSIDQAIIEYFVGKKKVFIFTILKNKINYKAFTKANDFEEKCDRFKKYSSGVIAYDEVKYRECANSLFELLLDAPLKAMDEKVSRLIFIPDDLLLQFSFDNLLYAKAEKGKPFPYLINKYSISTAYSNQLLFKEHLLKNSRHADKIFGGFGLEYDNFTLAGLNIFNPASGDNNTNKETAKLVFSDDEVMEIAAFLKGKAWINEAATKANFLKNAKDYRMLHFATHGIMHEEIPLNSSLIFFRADEATDFVLRASELYRLELNAELVVLSACHTGAGKIAKGEGVRSLARAFAYAGSPALVTSLWSASDYSTKEILIAFYQNLQKAMPKDVALQQAKLAYLENTSPSYAVPSYWAHLTVVGNTAPIVFNIAQRSWASWIIGGLALIAILFFKRLYR